MAALTIEKMQDILKATLKDLGPNRWTNLSTDLQEFHALPNLLRRERVQLDSGTSIQRSVMQDHQHSARAVGLFAVDDVNVRDQMTNIDIPWRHATANFALERREVAMNREPARIYNLIKSRRAGMMMALAEKLEEFFWSILSADDGVTPFGLPYWANKYASGSTTPSFSGTLPWTSTYPGGLNHDRWKNWAGQYVNVSVGDLLKKMRRAYRKCQFRSPVPMPSYDRGRSPRYVIYSNIDVVEELEDIAISRNENLGSNLAVYHDETTFRGAPIRWVPYLDDDTDDPVYFVDWSKFYFVFLRGEYMNESMNPAPKQHTVSEVHVDLTVNTGCHDVRSLSVLSTGTDKS